MKKSVLLSACLLLTAMVSAQCPKFLSCPSTPDTLCDLTDNSPQFWQGSVWYDLLYQKFDLPEAAVDLQIAALDSCGLGGLAISFFLKLDLDGDGQPETGIWSDSLNAPDTVFFNNLNQPGGQPRPFDMRPVSAAEKFRFALETFSNADTVFARLRWNTAAKPDTYVLPQLPAGRHEILWTATTPNGTQQTCSRSFWIRDCKPPVVKCINGLSVNILPTKWITLWDTDFLQYTEDNHTPSNLITLGIRKKGDGTGFPLNPDGTAAHHITFTCDEIGTQGIELWALDKADNAAFCETTVIIQDVFWLCTTPITVKSCIVNACGWAWSREFYVSVSDTSGNNWYSLTNAQGCATVFYGPHPIPGDITVSASLNESAKTTVQSINRLKKHLDGSEPLDNPYLFVAADVNNDLKVDSNDLAEMIKVITGFQTNWTNNASWRFIPRFYNFPWPHPPTASIPSVYVIDPSVGTLDPLDFIAVQIGNLNPCGLSPADEAPATWARQVRLLPNPTAAGARLLFEAPLQSDFFLKIFDTAGRLVFEQTVAAGSGAQQIEIPAGAFPATGIYVWQLSDGWEVVSGKAVRL